jgi:hypothetical protein
MTIAKNRECIDTINKKQSNCFVKKEKEINIQPPDLTKAN